MLIRKMNYNQKIDFLICKQLLDFVPTSSDELKFRDCFFGKRQPKYKHELEITEVRDFLEKRDIRRFTPKDVNDLYRLLTKDEGNSSIGVFCDVETIEDVELLARIVEKTSINNKRAFFKILLFKGYCAKNTKPLIPYRHLCGKIYDSILDGNMADAKFAWERLLAKTEKLQLKHDLKQNAIEVGKVERNASDFLKTVGAKSFFLYGSLATGSGTEYSDVDLLTVFADDAIKLDSRAVCYGYWKDILEIPFDMMVVSESDFDRIDHPAITDTLRKIGEIT